MGRRGTRELDLVLFGATGFTGRLVAEVLAARRTGIRWALAGRDAARLRAVRAGLAALDPGLADLPIAVADAHDRPALDALARRARVVCTTVGPYALHGSDLLAACAAAGTAYCDLTGEPHWIRAMIDAHHAEAEASGARIVPCCGFDSIPSDLGVWMLHDHLRRADRHLAEAHFRVRGMRGGASGGTVASMLALAERARDPAVRRILGNPYALDPAGSPRGPDRGDSTGPRKDPRTGRWTGPFVMASINTRVVRRTNALLDHPYGPGFRYDEVVDLGPGPAGFARAAVLTGVLGGLLAGAAFAPTRRVLARLAPKPGEGPDRARRESGRFRIEIDALAQDGGRLQGVVAADRDPGYGATSTMLAEAALSLVEDDLPDRGGLLTPASCLGMRLVDRLRAAGMTFEVRDPAA